MPENLQQNPISSAVSQNMPGQKMQGNETPPPRAGGAQQGSGNKQVISQDESNVPPEQQQEQYEQLMDNISIMVDGEKGATEAHENIMKTLEAGSGNPGSAIAAALTKVGDSILSQAEKNGITLTDEMFMSAATETIMMLVELAAEAGFFEATDEDIANGYAEALMTFMQTHPDIVNWDALQAEVNNLDPQAIDGALKTYNAEPGGQGGPPPGAGAPPGAGPPAGPPPGQAGPGIISGAQ